MMSDSDEDATRGPAPDVGDDTIEWVPCPTCEPGQPPPADGGPCVVCAGGGLVRGDVAEEITRGEGMELRPPGAG